MSLRRYECFLIGDSPGEEAVERDELLLPDGPDVVLEGLLQLVQLIPQLVRRRRVVPAHAQTNVFTQQFKFTIRRFCVHCFTE